MRLKKTKQLDNIYVTHMYLYWALKPKVDWALTPQLLLAVLPEAPASRGSVLPAGGEGSGEVLSPGRQGTKLDITSSTRMLCLCGY